jgi:two-component system, LytTR family, response regulator
MQKAYRTILVDDEPLAHERLAELLKQHKDVIEITAYGNNGDDAYKLIEELKPDVVFLDIQMPGKNVFDLLREISYEPAVIFCTAYDQYAIKAFETNSIDYLLKPVEKERLAKTISKISKHLIQKMTLKDIADNIEKQIPKPEITSIPYKTGDKIILIKLEEITYFEANDKYVNFYNQSGKSFLTDYSLKYFESILPKNFIRVSKSIIINKDYLKELNRMFKGKFLILLNDVNQTKIETGGFYTENIRKELGLDIL